LGLSTCQIVVYLLENVAPVRRKSHLRVPSIVAENEYGVSFAAAGSGEVCLTSRQRATRCRPNIWEMSLRTGIRSALKKDLRAS